MTSPSNIIKLLGGVPTTELKDMRAFPSRSKQLAYFNSKVVRTFTNVTYQRMEQTVNVKRNIELLQGRVNYLMFQNTQYSTRWYFAHILKMEYVNKETTKIYFEIDPFQTWGVGMSDGDITFGECFIEREHTRSDNIGEHRVEENLSIGELKILSEHDIEELKELWYVIGTTYDPINQEDVEGDVYGELYSGLTFFAYDNAVDVNDFIKSMQSKPEAIQVMFATSKYMSPEVVPSRGGYVSNFPVSVKTYDVVKNESKVDGYPPRNKKLLGFPYNFFTVSNNQGNELTYRYEDFNEFNGAGLCTFQLHANFSPNQVITMTPSAYRSDVATVNKNESITLTDFPQLAWSYDIFGSWLATNQIRNSLSVLGAGATLGLAMFAPIKPVARLNKGMSGASKAGSLIGTLEEKSFQPNPIRGSLSGSGNIGIGRQTFTIQKKCVREEHAKIIDDFFNKYGYAVNRVGHPDFNTRQYWTYVKLTDVTIMGDIPKVEKMKIVNQLQEGVTFWHVDDVGNYNRVNPVIT